MDGAALVNWLSPDAAQREVRYNDLHENLALGVQPGAMTEGDAALWEQLRNLGYVE